MVREELIKAVEKEHQYYDAIEDQIFWNNPLVKMLAEMARKQHAMMREQYDRLSASLNRLRDSCAARGLDIGPEVDQALKIKYDGMVLREQDFKAIFEFAAKNHQVSDLSRVKSLDNLNRKKLKEG